MSHTHLEQQKYMRKLLDDFHALIDQMVLYSPWHWAADEDEILTLILEIRLLERGFKDTLKIFKEGKNGITERRTQE